MGTLARYLQHQFQQTCPDDWTVDIEAQVLPDNLRRMLGYAPQVDVLLQRNDGSQRLWVEFEISRADPVANHAKFATGQMFQPRDDRDAFISMMSPDIASGKRNLGANTIWVMRYLGMRAYQTTLVPHLTPKQVKQLNHLEWDTLDLEKIDVQREVNRAIDISTALTQQADADIYFVANNMEAILNLHQWHQDIATPAGKDLWGRRTITYFVYDRRTGRFAPSKFCAYIFAPRLHQLQLPLSGATITMQQYVQIDHGHKLFDGGRARTHLVRNLAMRTVALTQAPRRVRDHFHRWLAQHDESINVHPNGARFLMPPDWF